MSKTKPGLILSMSVMAQMLIDNLDRPHSRSAAMAADILTMAAEAEGVPAHNADQWRRAVALYESALIVFAPPGADAPPLPDDWQDHQPPAEAYDEAPGFAEWVGLDADEIAAMQDPAPADFTEPAAPEDTPRKPRVTFEP